MQKKKMGIILIIVGAFMLIIGIVLVASKSADVEQPQEELNLHPEVVVVEKEVHYTVTVQSEPEVRVDNDSPEKLENTNNTSKEKGDAYEDFVVNLLADWRLTLLDRTQDAVSSAGVVAESCKNPDLHVQQKRGKRNIDYYLECKYRSNWNDGKVTFEDWQLDRYRQFQRDNQRKVIFALGVGGTPSAPATFMLVPLDSVKGNAVKQIYTQYAVQPNSTALVEYMDTYFTKVFDVAKERRQNKKKD